MSASVLSCATIGIDACPVDVEVDVARGVPSFSTVGLPDNAVKESRDRIRSAVRNSGYAFPAKKITVNLAPADIKKEGTIFDLPSALGILMAEGVVKSASVRDFVIVGELSLDGTVKPVRGALSAAVWARSAGKKLIVPRGNGAEAAIVSGLEVYEAASLSSLVEFIEGREPAAPCAPGPVSAASADGAGCDLSEVRGQQHVKRALEVAAAGGHNVLMIGPPGSGKTMLARRLPTILPPMTLDESIETTKVHSVAGAMDLGKALVTERPFRAPHHSISDAGLIGGGRVPRPGEVSLAHNGVLFLDELPEFQRGVLEALRQPMEDGRVQISRAAMTVVYPSAFMMVGAMNPCPCGFLGDFTRECVCTPNEVAAYRGRLSGPLLDRIDIHCEAARVRFKELTAQGDAEPSKEVRRRVAAARAAQASRLGSGVHSNARMKEAQIKAFCRLDAQSKKLVETAVDRLGLSARAYTRILKVARTIADLEGAESIAPAHVAEAIQYRTLDRPVG